MREGEREEGREGDRELLKEKESEKEWGGQGDACESELKDRA